MIARGIRMHNPGNVKASHLDWDGEIKPSQDAIFCQFKAPWWGIRAIAKLLMNYRKMYGLVTVASIISRYAPKGGHDKNHTDAYVAYVARAMGIGATTLFEQNYYNMENMVRAMIGFECGSCPYTWEIATGLIMAGVEPQATVVEPGQLSYQFKESKNG